VLASQGLHFMEIFGGVIFLTEWLEKQRIFLQYQYMPIPAVVLDTVNAKECILSSIDTIIGVAINEVVTLI
jgi:hypothetical protein